MSGRKKIRKDGSLCTWTLFLVSSRNALLIFTKLGYVSHMYPGDQSTHRAEEHTERLSRAILFTSPVIDPRSG